MNTLRKDMSYFCYETEESDSGIEGLFCIGEERYRARNYIESQGYSIEEENSMGIAVLKNVWVEEEERGSGIGSELVESFITEAKERDMQVIYLVADTGESNTFDIVSWYESFGFVKVSPLENYPLMKWVKE